MCISNSWPTLVLLPVFLLGSRVQIIEVQIIEIQIIEIQIIEVQINEVGLYQNHIHMSAGKNSLQVYYYPFIFSGTS